jgi:23S rRNA pseudouridine1911/1915/1917 synthase
LQEYGVGIFEATVTKSALKKVLKKEHLTVDGEIATSATLIKGGEKICLVSSEKESSNRKLDLKLKVLFEDDYLAIIHKPAGILVSGNTFKTIANALPQNLKTSNLSDATTPQPIHRLDFGTTGLLLVGKMNRSIRALNKLFEKQEIQKTYYAVTIGEMRYFGRITSPIDDKEAQSNYTLGDSVSSERFGKLNLVQLEPKTGRKHQLRKHLSSIGNPILGDTDYGIENLILKGKGLYLHAYSLKFIHPFTNELVHVKDELPEKFKKMFTQQE